MLTFFPKTPNFNSNYQAMLLVPKHVFTHVVKKGYKGDPIPRNLYDETYKCITIMNKHALWRGNSLDYHLGHSV